MQVENNDLRSAVKALRKKLELSQTDFGRLVGKGIATIQRYETLVPPRGKALAQLHRLALEKGFHEYAMKFHHALILELGAAASYKLVDIETQLLVLRTELRNGSASPEKKVAHAITEIDSVLKHLEEWNAYTTAPEQEEAQ